MTIHNKTPLMLAEVKEMVGKMEEKQELKDYLKKFTKLSKEKAEKMRQELRELNNIKFKEENIVKLVDFAPQSTEELNKVFTETSLTEEEVNAVLNITKKN